jgi:hypothetical protein
MICGNTDHFILNEVKDLYISKDSRIPKNQLWSLEVSWRPVEERPY